MKGFEYCAFQHEINVWFYEEFRVLNKEWILSKKPIVQIVAKDYRTTQIFKNHEANFYFRQNRSVIEIAEEHKLNVQLLLDEIEAVQKLENE